MKRIKQGWRDDGYILKGTAVKPFNHVYMCAMAACEGPSQNQGGNMENNAGKSAPWNSEFVPGISVWIIQMKQWNCCSSGCQSDGRGVHCCPWTM